MLMARKKDSGQLFAVKAIQKVHLQQEDKAKTTMAEIKINQQLKHPFIVPLYWAFQSVNEK